MLRTLRRTGCSHDIAAIDGQLLTWTTSRLSRCASATVFFDPRTRCLALPGRTQCLDIARPCATTRSATAEAILDIETRAAIFIQRQFRRHMTALKQRRRGFVVRGAGAVCTVAALLALRNARRWGDCSPRNSKDGTGRVGSASRTRRTRPRVTSPTSSPTTQVARAQAATGGQVRLADDGFG